MQAKKYNMKGCREPMPISDIAKFEKKNGFGVRVYTVEGKEIVPLHIFSRYFDRQLTYLQISATFMQIICKLLTNN